MKNLKKLLLIGALIVSVNAFSAVTLNTDGGILQAGSGIVGGSTYTINNSGSVVYTTATSYIDAGTTFNIAAGATFTITNAAGTQIYSTTGPTVITLTSNLTGAETNLNNVATVTAGTTPTPTPTPTPVPTPTPTPTPVAPTSSTKYYIPRSKVDLDLTKNITSSGFNSLEQAGNTDSGTSLDLQYIGSSGRFTDNSNAIKYKSKSNGVALLGSKKFGNFTIGGGFGYQDSKVKYREDFDGIKENLDSYQFMLGGKYNFTENVDLSSILTYSHNSHKYSSNGVNLEGTKFNSKIIDFQTRLGAKHGDENAYVKPYVGLGITSVKEGAIDAIGAQKASGTSANATVGVLGQVALGSFVDLYGNVEYEHRFNNKSYHRNRDFVSGNGHFEGLDYDSPFNLGVGLRYKLNTFNITTGYELKDTDNHVFKVGFGAEF